MDTTATPLATLGREIAGINAATGWDPIAPSDWSDTPYRIPAVLCLIHSEVTEAAQARVNDDADDYAEELADVVMRVVGCLHGLGADADAAVRDADARVATGFEPAPADVDDPADLHAVATAALEAFRHDNRGRFDACMGVLVLGSRRLAARYGLDLDQAVTEKLAKNRRRAFRHGGKRV